MKNVFVLTICVNIFWGTTWAQVKLLTGQPEVAIPIADIATKTGTTYPIALRYKGDGVYFSTNKGNDIKPVSWCGLGWDLVIPSVKVIHKNTVAVDDDRWFYNDENGATDEIIRVFDNNVENFYLKHKPYVKITPHYHIFADEVL
jgi:hypothetical protein